MKVYLCKMLAGFCDDESVMGWCRRPMMSLLREPFSTPYQKDCFIGKLGVSLDEERRPSVNKTDTQPYYEHMAMPWLIYVDL